MAIFSNGTDFLLWQEDNCCQCSKYENISTCEAEAGCKLAFHLDMAACGGEEVPQRTIDAIGYDAEKNRINRVCNQINKKS